MTISFRSLEVGDMAFREGGRVDTTVTSRALGDRRADCSFWMPVGANPDDRLPLVILLHGVGASHWAWFGMGGAAHIASSMIATGQLPPFALAAPSDGLLGFGSGYVAQGEANVPSWILDEVPDLANRVDGRVDSQAGLGLIGLSMGGFGALRLAVDAGRGRIPAAVGLSSITTLKQHSNFGVDPLPTVTDDRSLSIIASLDQSKEIGDLRLVCGSQDPLIDANRVLHNVFVSRRIAHEWVEDEGDHSWAYWRKHLPDSLAFVVSRLGTRFQPPNMIRTT